MDSSNFNSSNDYFIQDRDQDAVLNTPHAQSTQKTLNNSYENTQSLIIEDMNEIINTGDENIVLYQEPAALSILATAQEDTLPIRRFATNNPIIRDDEFMSRPRNYENMDN